MANRKREEDEDDDDDLSPGLGRGIWSNHSKILVNEVGLKRHRPALTVKGFVSPTFAGRNPDHNNIIAFTFNKEILLRVSILFAGTRKLLLFVLRKLIRYCEHGFSPFV